MARPFRPFRVACGIGAGMIAGTDPATVSCRHHSPFPYLV
jgi:hypothetical protein